MTPRSEPLLWLQLIALGAIPLELLLLLLLLAGADPGPVPGLERVLVWGLGALAPALLFWRRPPDICSLLLVQVPLRGRTPLQRSLSRLQGGLIPKLLALLGAAALLPLLWTLDSHAAFAMRFSPLSSSNRFTALLLSLPLLTVLLWQWQQLMQSLWLLTRPQRQLEECQPMGPEELADQRLCLGMPLLLLEPLRGMTLAAPPQPDLPTAPAPAAEAEPEISAPLAPEPVPLTPEPAPPGAEPEAPAAEPQASVPESPEPSVAVDDSRTVAIEPEQASEEGDGPQLDEHIP